MWLRKAAGLRAEPRQFAPSVQSPRSLNACHRAQAIQSTDISVPIQPIVLLVARCYDKLARVVKWVVSMQRAGHGSSDMIQFWVLAALLLFAVGCGQRAPAGAVRPAVEREHSHYHIHAPDVEHEHAHRGNGNGGVHGNHFEYETTWVGAVREITDPTDDHGHMVLFQTGHTPNHPLSDDRDVSAPHSGVAQFLMCDGSVHSVRESIDQAVYAAMGTINGGEVASGL